MKKLVLLIFHVITLGHLSQHFITFYTIWVELWVLVWSFPLRFRCSLDKCTSIYFQHFSFVLLFGKLLAHTLKNEIVTTSGVEADPKPVWSYGSPNKQNKKSRLPCGISGLWFISRSYTNIYGLWNLLQYWVGTFYMNLL